MGIGLQETSQDENLILVDLEDNEIGSLEKLAVHQKGLLHRAFSVFIFNSEGKLLIQKRAAGKYHSPELWTNTCCSHPRQAEPTSEAVKRRLAEEMGLKCNTDFKFKFTYRVEFENGLTEHEIDHVYIGYSDERPVSNENEVMDWKYIGLDELEREIQVNPEHYTVWLRICLPKVILQFNPRTI